MTGKAYNAGTIFLQVVPVFGELQNEIGREAKKASSALSDEMEKGGREAGKNAGKAMGEELTKSAEKDAEKYIGAFATKYRNGMRAMNKELQSTKLRIEVEDEGVQKTFDKIQARAKALRNIKVGVDLTAKEAVTELARLELQLKLLQEQAKNIQVKADLKTARAQVSAFVAGIQKEHPEVKIDADFKKAERSLGDFEQRFSERMKKAAGLLGDSLEPEIRKIKNELDTLGDEEIGLTLHDEDAKASLRFLIAEMKKIDGKTLSISARANISKTMAELLLLDAEIKKLDGEEIKVDTDKTAKSIGDTSNNFRALNGVLLAVMLLIPALIPLIAALGGALLALGPAIAGVGVGFGVMALGFSGVAAAVKAMGAVHKNAAKDAETSSKRIRAAARSVSDAERSLTRTRQDVAQRNADAARAVADAERSAADGVKAALRQRADAVTNAAKADRDAAAAQRDLVKARKEAKAELQDNKDTLAQNALDQRQGVIDVFNATVTDQTTRQDGGATNLEKEQAAINLANAQLRLKNLREEGVALAQRDKAGVEGTTRVQSAQDALSTALERQRKAHEAVGEASKAVDKARADGARQVARAVQQQQRTEADGQRSLADAQRGLLRAQQDYQDALHATGDIGSSSMNTLRDAMAKLSPAGQRFARFLYGLRGEFYAIRTAAQEGMLPGVQSALETITNRYGKPFIAFVRSMADTIGDMFRRFGKMLTNPLWSDFFGMLAKLGPRFFRQFAKMSMNWMSFFARLLTIAAPWAKKFSDALLAASKHALNFIKSKKGTKVITDFMAYAAKVGPKVWGFFKDLWGAVVNLMVALAPLGELVLGAVDGFLKLIKNIPPKVLGAIVTIIIMLVLAFQALNFVLAIASIATTLWAAILTPVLGPILLIVAGVIAFIGVLILLYTQSDTARKIMQAAFHGIVVAIKWVIDFVKKHWVLTMTIMFGAVGFAVAMIIKHWDKVKAAIKWVWDKVLHPIFKAIGAVVKWLWDKVFKPALANIATTFRATMKVLKWVWDNILFPVIDLIGKWIWKLWKFYFKVALTAIGIAWKAMSTAFKWVWNHIIKPIFDAFMDVIGNKVVSAFQTAVGAIGKAWDSLRGWFQKPIKAVIEFANKYLIGGFNKIADFVGSKHMGDIPVPGATNSAKKSSAPKNAGGSHGGALNSSFQTGGVLPGYTPGRDVHHFRSPTAGNLHLSGGEGILRPEVIKAAGANWLHRLNAWARKGGVSGVRKAMGMTDSAFAKGGVFWPVPGRDTTTYPGHDGVDINRGSGWQDFGDPIRAFRPGRIVYVGSGRGYGDAIYLDADQGPTVVMGHTSAQYVRAGQHVAGGQLLGRVGNTGHSSAPHLHFGIPGGTFAQALALLNGAVMPDSSTAGGGGMHLPGWLSKIAGGPLAWVKGLASKASGAMQDKFGDNGLVKLLGGVTNKLVDGMTSKVKALLNGVSDTVSSAVGAATGSAQHIVQTMAAERGWTGAQWDAIREIVSRESGWNPDAANPTSSARGLFQKMTSIHGAIEGTVAGQANWGLNYIKSRYGNPVKALQHWNEYGSYADGGIIGSTTGSSADLAGGGGMANNGTMMYDNGGYLPPGLTQVVNLTGKPEPVFTSDQFAGMQGRGGSGEESFTYAPTFNKSDLTSQDVAHDLEFTMRKHGKLGKYGSRV